MYSCSPDPCGDIYLRKPNPYTGKGIKYIDEVIRRKSGKAAVGAGEG